MTTPSVARVLIALCTRKRQSMLRECLDSITALPIPVNWQLTLVVVENDTSPHSQAVVDEYAHKAPFPVFYRLEQRLGIPYARNCAIEEAINQQSDWLLFIDDDETADRQWLAGYAQALASHNADVIQGAVIYRWPENDRWVRLLDRNAANAMRPEGKRMHTAATNNVLISSRVFSPQGMNLRFDINFQFTGGSDTEFFKRARLRGATIVYSARPVVYETVPLERCSPRWLFQREARTTAALVCIDALHYGRTVAIRKHVRRALKNLLQSIGYLLQSMIFLAIRPNAARKQFLTSFLRFGRFYGCLLGLFGRMMSPYKVIDGVEPGI